MTVKYPKGTRVRATKTSYGGAFTEGSVYVLREDFYEGNEYIRVELDDLGRPTNGWVLTNFELATGSPANSFNPHGRPDKKILAAPKAVLGTQVGGSHYTDCAIQPIEYIWANKLGFSEGNIVKYVTRWRSKGGVKDLEKAKHHIALLIEHTLAEEAKSAL